MTEDDKKKKEKKSFLVITSVLAAMSAIVSSLPCSKGVPLVTVWGQILVDRLFDLLTHTNIDVRTVSARTLATFCSICSGGGRIENLPYKSHVRSIKNSTKISLLTKSKSDDRIDEKSIGKYEGKYDENLNNIDSDGNIEEGAWLIQACLDRLSSVLSSAFEKKGKILREKNCIEKLGKLYLCF